MQIYREKERRNACLVWLLFSHSFKLFFLLFLSFLGSVCKLFYFYFVLFGNFFFFYSLFIWKAFLSEIFSKWTNWKRKKKLHNFVVCSVSILTIILAVYGSRHHTMWRFQKQFEQQQEKRNVSENLNFPCMLHKMF